jgi:membrane protein
MTIRKLMALFKAAGKEWIDDKASRLGAALAYYTVFSLAPLMVIAIGIAGMVFRREAARDQIVDQIQELVGREGGEAIQAMIASAGKRGSGMIGTVAGLGMLLVGAIGLFGELQDALNTIWKVEPRPDQGIWGMVRRRLLSFSMVLGMGFLLTVSLIASSILTALMRFIGSWQISVMGHLGNEAVSLVVFTLLFAMIYRILPDVSIAWKDVWIGALLTSLFFEAGKFLIGFYLGHSAIASGYGAAGSFAVLLVWLYYSAQIFLFGAEFTKVYAQQMGSRTEPTENGLALGNEPYPREQVFSH